MELAESLGGDRHKNTVSDWENGRGNIKLGTLDEIAGVLGVNPVALVTLDSDDYRLAMEEAATIVEGGLEDIVEALRDRAEEPQEAPMEKAVTSAEAGDGGQDTGEDDGQNE